MDYTQMFLCNNDFCSMIWWWLMFDKDLMGLEIKFSFNIDHVGGLHFDISLKRGKMMDEWGKAESGTDNSLWVFLMSFVSTISNSSGTECLLPIGRIFWTFGTGVKNQ